jgi:ribosomal-protein-alanine N-acetyltransferase
MSQDLRIEVLLPAMAPQMHSIESQVYEDPWTLALLEQSFRAPLTHIVGYVDSEGQCWGYAIYQIVFTEAHLLNIAIHPDIKGQGKGKVLLEWVLRDAAARHSQSMFLEVRPSNRAAIKVYEQAGFRTLMMRDRYYSNGEAAAIMMIDLAPFHSTGQKRDEP